MEEEHQEEEEESRLQIPSDISRIPQPRKITNM
jgi:hypothetical protein